MTTSSEIIGHYHGNHLFFLGVKRLPCYQLTHPIIFWLDNYDDLGYVVTHTLNNVLVNVHVLLLVVVLNMLHSLV